MLDDLANHEYSPPGTIPVMARVKLSRRLGPVGTALTLWDLWRRLPKRQRKWVVSQARKHGPRLAKQAVAAQRTRRRRP
jgi:hypothetical protein